MDRAGDGAAVVSGGESLSGVSVLHDASSTQAPRVKVTRADRRMGAVFMNFSSELGNGCATAGAV